MGKASRRRLCPAVGREITPVECGTNRGVNYKCPPDCPFCPWSPDNYDDLLEIEKRIDNAVFAFYESVVGQREFQNQFGAIDDDDEDEEEGIFAMQEVCIREFFLRDFGSGKNLFDLWRESGWKGLDRDEPFLASFKTGSHLALLEVRRVVDGQTTECVDLLGEPDRPFIVCDRALAGQAVPFQCVLGWICGFPFFHRVHGVAWTLPNSVESGRERLLRMAAESGGPSAPGPELNAWLAGNFLKMIRALNLADKNRRMAAGRNTDFKECLAVYRWRDGFRDLNLKGRPDFFLLPEGSGDVEAFGPHQNHVWLRTGESAKHEDRLPKVMRSIPGVPGEPVWGHLRVFADRVEVTATADMLFRPMRDMVEEFFGDALVFEKEFVSDLAKQTFSAGVEDKTQRILQTSNFFREPPADLGQVMKQSMEARLRHVLDDEIPALGGLTPREASTRPESRPMLVDWMKGYIHMLESFAKKEGLVFDFDGVLDELALPELKIPRANRETAVPSTGWWRELDWEDIKNHALGPADSNVPNLSVFPELEAHFESIDESLLNEKELEALLHFADYVVGILVPPGVDPRPIRRETMRGHSKAVLDEVAGEMTEGLADVSSHEDPEEAGKLLEEILSRSPQPVLLMAVATMLASFDEQPASKSKIRKDNRFAILLQLEALMRCIRDIAV